MKFAPHSCSSRVTLPVIPLNQLLSGVLMTSIWPNPVVDSLFSFYSTSQQHSVQRTTPSLLLASEKFPRSLSVAPTSLAALSRCHLQTPPQGWTFQSCSIPGSHWTVFCSSPTRAVQPQGFDTIYMQNSPVFLSLSLTFPLGFQTCIFNSFLKLDFTTFLLFFFWMFCYQSFSSLAWLYYTRELIN